MATQRIINGPSKWDIMLSFFEEKPITFTLEDGTIVKISSTLCMWNMRGYDPLVGSVSGSDKQLGPGLAEAYLLRCFHDEPTQQEEVFIEYRLRSRQGLCVILGQDGLADDPTFLPERWSQIMELEEGNYLP